MSYFLRFTDNSNESKSFDHFNKTEFDGLCCFELGDNEDELFLSIRKAAENDNTYVNYYDGKFIVFEGKKIEDNPYGNGVIATKGNVVIEGKLTWNDTVRTYKIETTYANV